MHYICSKLDISIGIVRFNVPLDTLYVISGTIFYRWYDPINSVIVVVSGMQLTIPPQRAVLSQICCFGERKVVLFQILLDGPEPRDAGRPSCLLQSAGGEANRILLASALSFMRIICPNRVSRHDWIIAVSLGCLLASVHHHSVKIGTIWCQAAYADTTGRVHRSCMHPS